MVQNRGLPRYPDVDALLREQEIPCRTIPALETAEELGLSLRQAHRDLRSGEENVATAQTPEEIAPFEAAQLAESDAVKATLGSRRPALLKQKTGPRRRRPRRRRSATSPTSGWGR